MNVHKVLSEGAICFALYKTHKIVPSIHELWIHELRKFGMYMVVICTMCESCDMVHELRRTIWSRTCINFFALVLLNLESFSGDQRDQYR